MEVLDVMEVIEGKERDKRGNVSKSIRSYEQPLTLLQMVHSVFLILEKR